MQEKDRNRKRLIICLILFANFFGALMLFSLISVASGKANITISGIAADFEGLVYVGYDKGINVYSNSDFLKQIDIPTSRGYDFTVKNDKIILSDGETVYSLSLDGEILNKQPQADSEYIHSESSFKAENGDVYKVKSALFRTRIVKNDDTTVYRISNLDFAVKLIFEFCLISVAIFVPWFIKKYNNLQS